ncbi:hypothetical protein Q7C36_011369 [Tachysurus vachellii]|uniref:Uncharacterized protein n=1 Tax=Tachysurus vachellii TaxID=175792 RepID=A0AA88SU07_TACVA|nr:hypothetical protein Q7C36_011369 [Tachysurus vachellii]
MDGASLGKGAWPFSAEMAKLEVPINLPTDTISAVRLGSLLLSTPPINHIDKSQNGDTLPGKRTERDINFTVMLPSLQLENIPCCFGRGAGPPRRERISQNQANLLKKLGYASRESKLPQDTPPPLSKGPLESSLFTFTGAANEEASERRTPTASRGHNPGQRHPCFNACKKQMFLP